MKQNLFEKKIDDFFSKQLDRISLFAAVKDLISSIGTVKVSVKKSEISFWTKSRFAWVWLPRSLDKLPGKVIVLTFELERQVKNQQIVDSVETRPGRWAHHLVVQKKFDLNEEVYQWLSEAYAISLFREKKADDKRIKKTKNEQDLDKLIAELLQEQDRKIKVQWALDCAENVLSCFEDSYPDDGRPRNALETGRSWLRGDATVSEVRKAAFSAHAAARDSDNDSARSAAQAAGHAVSAAHVAGHAFYAATYAFKAVARANIATEREWQFHRLRELLSM